MRQVHGKENEINFYKIIKKTEQKYWKENTDTIIRQEFVVKKTRDY